jgi:hypothetical protein
MSIPISHVSSFISALRALRPSMLPLHHPQGHRDKRAIREIGRAR